MRFLRRRREPPLKPLEKTLLDALAAHLSPEAQVVLAEQIRQVNLVQRDAGDKEVRLYHMERGKPTRENVPLFPNTVPEVRLARISFVAADKPKGLRVEFWLVQGTLFSLQFDQSPRGIDASRIEIKDVKVMVDPMVPAVAERREPIEADTLTDWPREWSRKWAVARLREPLPGPDQQRILAQLDAKLPTDYLELVAQTEGLELPGCVVYGLSEVRSVVLPEANYYVLSELADRGVVAVQEGKADGTVFFVDYEGQEEDMGFSFRDAIERLLERQ